MKNYNRKKQKKRDVKPAKKVVIWGMSTPNSEEEEERDASPGSRQPSCHDSSRMDSVMAAGITRHHHHDMPNRVQPPEEEQEEERVDTSGGDVSLANGRERLKRHRTEVAGRVWIPEIWGHEEFLMDLVDCTVFDSSLVPSKIMSARAALVEEARRASSPVLGVGNRH